MKKFLRLGSAALLLSATTASAQFNYSFSFQTGQTYSHLTTAPLNGTNAYDDALFLATLPFTAQLDGRTMDTAWAFRENVVFNTLTEQFVSGFLFTDADLADKGSFDTTASQSPVRKDVSGSAPNRIFKFEYANIGFFDEWDLYSTRDDSANIQIWIYEGSNIVELRYGPSSVTHFNDYFDGGMQIGLLHDLDLGGGGGTFYYLKGSPSAPSIDSVDINSPSAPNQLLTFFPSNGTVYRFTPKSLGIGAVAGNVSLNVFPTLTSSSLNVTYGDAGTAAYSILSMNGAVVQNGLLQSGKNTLEVAALPAGNYILQARNSAGQGTFRFTKQ